MRVVHEEEEELLDFPEKRLYRNTELGDGKVWFFGSFVIVVFC